MERPAKGGLVVGHRVLAVISGRRFPATITAVSGTGHWVMVSPDNGCAALTGAWTWRSRVNAYQPKMARTSPARRVHLSILKEDEE